VQAKVAIWPADARQGQRAANLLKWVSGASDDAGAMVRTVNWGRRAATTVTPKRKPAGLTATARAESGASGGNDRLTPIGLMSLMRVISAPTSWYLDAKGSELLQRRSRPLGAWGRLGTWSAQGEYRSCAKWGRVSPRVDALFLSFFYARFGCPFLNTGAR
jgi:hypothetical protein